MASLQDATSPNIGKSSEEEEFQELEKDQGVQGSTLDEKISKALELLGGDCQNVEFDSLIEVGKELVELAVAAKENFGVIDKGYDFEGMEKLVLKDGVGNMELLSPQSGKKRKLSEGLDVPKSRLGIHQRDIFKSSPDCGEHKKRGRILNQESGKWMGMLAARRR